ncbi:hypothetical protein DSO57_1004398 [Entomophthora muscae]|uniref:Uncharacterized protein n=1 Tax=Entomophthora muscae TaxID=34485 RepID=A0ACC2SX52_9FUNG|nr:hypothetical protein DSO57_1004398 [Entomophthora muscae]
MQDKYKLLTNHSLLLENDNSSKPVPGYNPGHTLGTGDQEPHNLLCSEEQHRHTTGNPNIGIVSTEPSSLPASASYNTQGALKESPLDVSNGMEPSDVNIELWALSPN